MPEFTDNENRKWTLELSVPLGRRAKQLLGLNILDADTVLPRMAEDPVLLCDILWILVEEQATHAKVTDEEFGRGLRGAALEQAIEAFLEALMDFSPPRQSETLKLTLKTGREIEEILRTTMTMELPKQLTILRSILGTSSDGSKPSSDSPGPGVSEA